jgi:hypothetical protein
MGAFPKAGAALTARAKLDAVPLDVLAKSGYDRRGGGRVIGRNPAWFLKRAMGLEPTTLSLGSRTRTKRHNTTRMAKRLLDLRGTRNSPSRSLAVDKV